MPWIDPWGNHYEELPSRIRLADFTTRTAHEATPENALAGGWVQYNPTVAEPAPEPAPDTVLGA